VEASTRRFIEAVRLAVRVNQPFRADTDRIGSWQIRLPFDGHGGWISVASRERQRLSFSHRGQRTFTKPCNRPPSPWLRQQRRSHGRLLIEMS